MNWKPTLFLSGFVALIVLDGQRNMVKATMGGSSGENSRVPLVLKKKLFVQKLAASNFLKKPEIRSERSKEEFYDQTRPGKLENEDNDTEEWNSWERSDPEYGNEYND